MHNRQAWLVVLITGIALMVVGFIGQAHDSHPVKHYPEDSPAYDYNCYRDGNKLCAPGYSGDGYTNH